MLLTALLPLMVGRAAAAPTCSSKRGLAWPTDLNTGVPFTNFKNSMSAYYTWSSTPVTDAPYPFAPMLWGCSAENTSRFETALSTAFKVDNYTPKLLAHKAVLGFSEPAIKSQSNCAPAQAAAVWRQHVEPLKNKGYRLGTPAVTFDDLGRSWMSEFFAECHNCTFDFVAVHWYGTKVSDLQKTMEEVYTVYKRPIWLTEFAAQNFDNSQHIYNSSAAQPSLIETKTLLTDALRWLDSTGYIERYFWYGAMYNMQSLNDNDMLFDATKPSSSGNLSDLGALYISNPTTTLNCTGYASAASASRTPSAAAVMLVATMFALYAV